MILQSVAQLLVPFSETSSSTYLIYIVTCTLYVNSQQWKRWQPLLCQRINTKQWKRPAFSMWSDPVCTQQSKELLFSTGSGPAQQCKSVFFGVRPRGYITRVFSEPVAVGWESWVSYELVTWTVPVTSEYSGRAAVFREELQNCRRTDPTILEERQRVKIQCEDSASEL
jgi:hypothetical protein